ncbi:MAG TPA: transglutaminaseTgpA domain-containing protein, partial [Chloroflexota bacterium]|nr:transglutaminaseTgpA domain-containing protein [Chloroflexota bacterium]
MRRDAFSELVNTILLAVVVLAPAWAIGAEHLDPQLSFRVLSWVALVGIFVGMVCAYSDLAGEVVHPFTIVGGAAGVFYLITRIMPDVPPEASFHERLQELIRQIVEWFSVVIAGGQATNNLLFLLLLALVAWYIGYFGGWSVFRARSAWWPVTASATALTLILATFPDLYLYMLVELVAAMLLIGRLNLESRQMNWQLHGLRQANGLTFRAFRASLALALALVILTWLAPAALAARAFSQQLGQISRPWEQAQTDFNRLFGGLQSQQDQASLSGFGRTMSFHGSFHLADTPVLQIQSPRPEYWRAAVFDTYTGHGWQSSDPIDQQYIPAGASMLGLPDQQRFEIAQQITVLQPRGNYLVGAAQPFQFDRAVSAQAYPDAPGGQVDLIAAFATQSLVSGSHYTVVSDVSTASESQLRTSNQAYPAEVRQRYLPLPPVPERVHQLAIQLTENQPDTYDKAVAVESYLRSMPYSLDVPPPPPGQDGVDYFLFNLKTGYCDYFASAMAVMLRSVGIPARVVSGYATGTQQGDGSYIVKDSDSHSWTEVYFPPYGWVSFEPSGGWPTFQRGSGNQSAVTPMPVPTTQPQPSVNQSQTQVTPTPTATPTSVPGGISPTVAATRPPPSVDLHPLLPLLIFLSLLIGLALLAWYLWERGLRGKP